MKMKYVLAVTAMCMSLNSFAATPKCAPVQFRELTKAEKLYKLAFKDYKVHAIAIATGLAVAGEHYLLGQDPVDFLDETTRPYRTEKHLINTAIFASVWSALYPSETLGGSMFWGVLAAHFGPDRHSDPIRSGIAFAAGDAVGSIIRNSADIILGTDKSSVAPCTVAPLAEKAATDVN